MGAGACGGADEVPPSEGARCDDEVCTGVERWSVSLEVNADGDATIGPNGHVYVTSGIQNDRGLVSGRITAFEDDGTRLWRDDFSLPAQLGWPSRPAMHGDALYVTAYDGLFKYTTEGEREYVAFAPEGSTKGVNLSLLAPAPAVGADGTVYWQFLAASRPDGSLSWRDFVDPRTQCQSPVSASSDRLLIRVDDRIDAYNADGVLVWSQEAPYGLRADEGCTIVPVGNTVITSWCEPTASFFVCGHTVRMNLVTGELLSHSPPPRGVPVTSTILVDTDGSLVHFSVGPDGNPDYRSSMWRLTPNGNPLGEATKLPWFGVYGAALGNDGLFYVSTSEGAAALTREGDVVWSYEPPETTGFNAGAPAIGSNGCVFYEAVKSATRFAKERRLVCIESTATGLADTPWPRTTGGNHSANRAP